MKSLYISIWVLLAAAAVVSVVTGALNPVSVVAFSLTALGLVYALALWSVLSNTRRLEN